MAAAPVEINLVRLGARELDEVFNHRLRWSEARARHEDQDIVRGALMQAEVARGSGDFKLRANLDRLTLDAKETVREETARDVADVKLKAILSRRIAGDRIAAAFLVFQKNVDKLSGDEFDRLAGIGLQHEADHIGGHTVHRGNRNGDVAHELLDLHGDFHVTRGFRAAGQNLRTVGRHAFLAARGIRDEVARDNVSGAGAAETAATGVRDVIASALGGIQNPLALLSRKRHIGSGNFHQKSHSLIFLIVFPAGGRSRRKGIHVILKRIPVLH